jgi:hypothetical protein
MKIIIVTEKTTKSKTAILGQTCKRVSLNTWVGDVPLRVLNKIIEMLENVVYNEIVSFSVIQDSEFCGFSTKTIGFKKVKKLNKDIVQHINKIKHRNDL